MKEKTIRIDELGVTGMKALVTLMETTKRSSNPADEAKAIEVLQKKGKTQEEIANIMGVERSQIAKRVLLLKLVPALFKKLGDGRLRSSVARELAQMPEEEQEKWAKRDTVTLKEVQEARRPQTPKPDTSSDSAFPVFDLTEKERGILRHAYESGLLKPGKGTLPPLDGVAESYGMKKKTYSKNLVKTRRKILTKICEEMFK